MKLVQIKRLGIALLLSAALPFVASAQQLFSGGNGTKEDPYQIASEKDLNDLATYTKEDSYKNFEGKYFKQTADITLTKEFTPIGGLSTDLVPREGVDTPFCGHYDGGMKKIHNLNIFDNRQLTEKGETGVARSAVGLFGWVNKGGSVKNVVVASGTIYGMLAVGGIVGDLGKNCEVSHCKVGYKVTIFSRLYPAGIVGVASRDAKVYQCANYGTVIAEGDAAITGGAGGIVGQTNDAIIKGCANFGNVYNNAGSVSAGGIVAITPVSGSHTTVTYTFPTIESCMHVGDVSSKGTPAGGILGAYGYNDGEGAPVKIITKNCYVAGQAYVEDTKQFGPIAGAVLMNSPQEAKDTYYDENRFFYKKDEKFTDSEIAFKHGVAKSHDHIRSAEFLTELNNGITEDAYKFEEDKHNINYGMPVLKWINDSFDAAIDLPYAMVTNPEPAVHKEKVGIYFDPNRRGEFIMVNKDMQMPNIQMQALGFTVGRAWNYRLTPVANDTKYKFLYCTSRYRRPYDANGAVVTTTKPQAANRWLITPEFEVTAEKPYFIWFAASEDAQVLEGYTVYVGDESATMPENFKKSDMVYTTRKEDVIKFVEATTDEDAHYELHQRHIDLSKHAGKKVRLAFVDDSEYGFLLILGKFSMSSSPTSLQEVLPDDSYSVRIEGTTINARTNGEALRFELFDVMGQRLATAQEALTYTGAKGVYLLKAIDTKGRGEIRKIVL